MANETGLQVTPEKHKVPKLNDLLSDETMVMRIGQDDFNLILNTQPPKAWVKQNPFVKIKVPDGKGGEIEVNQPYLPVRRVKWLLNRIYGKYTWETKREGQILNSVFITGTLTVTNPLTGEKESQDGSGAAPIQMNKGATQGDLSAIKSNAIQIGLPAAESYALKCAAEKFGDIFGGNILNADNTEYTPMFDEETKKFYIPKQKDNGTETGK